MIFFIIAGFVTGVLIVWFSAEDGPEEGVLLGLILGAIGFVIAIPLAMGVGALVYDAEPYSYTFDVMAAKDGTQTHGQFGIFGGFIDEEPYYFFYRKYDDGRIVQGKIRANDTVIYQDQETQAFIKVNTSKTELETWGVRWEDPTTYEIHVPEGSVIEDVEFDLE